MPSLLVALLLASSTPPRRAHDVIVAPPKERAAFITTLGRDTVVIESFTRSDRHVEGDIVVRVPGTVLCHYSADLNADGAITHTVVDIKPLGTAEVRALRVSLDFEGEVVHITVEGQGQPQTVVHTFSSAGFPFFMTGFGSSYGLYSSLGMYEAFLPRVLAGKQDTTTVKSLDMVTTTPVTRQFVRHSPTQIDVDYFNIGWTGLTVDADGHITDAEANRTTEKTLSHRVDFIDVEKMAKAYAALDKAGTGVGAASSKKLERGTIGGQQITVSFGSPKKRDRAILGNVVPYDRVWRTGANEATTIFFEHDVTIGGNAVPAGTYSLWTLPAKDGTVQLIVNRQHGQWGTDYDPAQDLVRIPMHVETAAPPREDFAINVTGSGNAGELRMAWDTFAWSAPIALK